MRHPTLLMILVFNGLLAPLWAQDKAVLPSTLELNHFPALHALHLERVSTGKNFTSTGPDSASAAAQIEQPGQALAAQDQNTFSSKQAGGGCARCDGQRVVLQAPVRLRVVAGHLLESGSPQLDALLRLEKPGPEPSSWRLVLDAGESLLELRAGARLSVDPVDGNGPVPALELRSACGIQVDAAAEIVLRHDAPGGATGRLLLVSDGLIQVDGRLRNEALGAGAFAGGIALSSLCGGIHLGALGQLLLRAPQGRAGSIDLAAAYRGAPVTVLGRVLLEHGGAQPAGIRLAALDGMLLLDATQTAGADPFSGEPLCGGILLRSLGSAAPGRIWLQAKDDLEIRGFTGDDAGSGSAGGHAPADPLGALAIRSAGQAGTMELRSATGSIRLTGFALDNRNADAASGLLDVQAFGHLDLTGPGPVLDNSATAAGKAGGTNLLQAHNGRLTLADEATVLALGGAAGLDGAAPGVSGRNRLASCGGISDGGIVTPADSDPGDDLDLCLSPLRVAFITPAEAGIVGGTPVLVAGTVFPPSAQVRIGDTRVGRGRVNWDHAFPLADGQHALVAEAELFGRVASAVRTFRVDDSPPLIEIQAPNTVQRGKLLSVSWIIHDPSPLSYARIRLNGQRIDDRRQGTYSLPIPFSGDLEKFVLEIEAEDAVCHKAASRSHNIWIQPAELAVTILAPQSGLRTAAAQLQVSGSVSQEGARVRLNGGETSRGENSWTAPFTLREGRNTITALADYQGLSARDQIVVELDLTGPDLQLQVPPRAGQGVPFSYSWSAQDEAGIAATTLLLDGQVIASSAQGSGSTTVDYDDARAQLRFVLRAEDSLGNRSETQAEVPVLPARLDVAVSAPSAGTLTAADEILVQGGVSISVPGLQKTAALQVTVNGQPATLNGTSFQALVPLTGEGRRDLQVQAQLAGMHAGAATHVIRDTTGPQLTLALPAQAPMGSSFSYSWSAEDANGIAFSELRLDGQLLSQQPNGSGRHDLPYAPPPGQPLTFVLLARDTLGNETLREAQVQPTPVALQLTIDEPLPGWVTAAGQAQVRGTVLVTDTGRSAQNLSVTVNGLPASITGQQWLAALPLTAEGDILIEVLATLDGLSAHQVRTIVRDTRGPVISWSAPNQVTMGQSFEAQWTVNDEHQVASVQVSRDGTPISQLAQGSDPVQVPYDPGRGLYRYTITAEDSLGNRSQLERSIAVQSAALGISILEPAADLLTNAGSVAVSGQVSAPGGTGQVQVTVNGLAAALAPDGHYQLQLPLSAEGELLIQALATLGGLSAQAAVSIVRDVTPPDLELQAPASVTAGDVLSFTWLAQDNLQLAMVDLTFDGQSVAQTASGSYSLPVPVDSTRAGFPLRLHAVDSAGNEAVKEQSIAVQGKDLQIAITSPAAGWRTAAGQVTVSGSVLLTNRSAGQPTVTVNGLAATVTGEQWSLDLPLSGEGPITLVARAGLGTLSAETSRTIIRDSLGPAITLSAPDLISEGESLTFSWTVEDPSGLGPVSVRRNGTEVSSLGQGSSDWSVPAGSGLAEILLNLTAEDSLGNSSQASHRVSVQSLDLSLAITAPAGGTLTRAGEIQVQGTVQTALRSAGTPQVQVNGQAATLTGEQWSLTLALEGEGPIALNAVATLDHLTAAHSVTIVRDISPPTIMIEAPASLPEGETLTYSWSVSDANGLDQLRVTRDGQEISTSPQGSGTFPLAVTGQAGEVVLRVEARDLPGNESSREHRVAVQPLDLQLAITAPSDGALSKDESLLVSGTVTTALRAGSPGVRVNGEAATVTGETWQITLPLPNEGANPIQASATLGGLQASDHIQVIRDTQPPQISLQAPSQIAPGETLTFSWQAVDANGPQSVTVTRDGQPVSGEAVGSSSYPIPADAANGTITLRVQATDLLGWQAEHTQIVALVRGAISLQVTQPAANALVTAAPVVLGGSVMPADAAVSVDGTPATNNGGQWQVSLELADGHHNLRVHATRSGLDPVEHFHPFALDTAGPTLTIEAPASFIPGRSANVTVRAEDPAGIQWQKLNAAGVDLPPSNLATAVFAVQVPAGETRESYLLTATAADAYGHESHAEVTVPVMAADQLEMVQIQLESPADEALFGQPPIQVSGQVVPADATLTLLGQPVALDDQGRFAHDFTLEPGPNNLMFKGTHPHYLDGFASRDFYLDNIDPVIRILSPENPGHTRAAAVTISGTLSDHFDREPSLTRDGQPVTLHGDRFLEADVPLAEGENRFVYRAEDAVGNHAELTLVVVRKSSAPQVEIQAPARILPGQSFEVQVQATPAGDIRHLSLSIDGQELAAADQQASVSAGYQHQSTGSNAPIQITALASDRYGNQAMAQAQVLIDGPRYLYGQVLDDATSYPLAGITLTLEAPGESQTLTTAADGSYQATTHGIPVTLRIEDAAYLPACRRQTEDLPAWRVPDFRLTARQDPDSFTASHSWTLAEPPNLRISWEGSGAQQAALTPFTRQGLPELLPLGYSPLAGFELHGLNGLGTLLWSLDRWPLLRPGSSLLLLENHAGQWLVRATHLLERDGFTLSLPDSGNGTYLAAIPDQWFSAAKSLPKTGQPLRRLGDTPVRLAEQVHTGTYPQRISVLQDAQTLTQFRFATNGSLPSGSRVRIRAHESHDRYHETLDLPAYTLDLFCYSLGFGHQHQPSALGGLLQVRCRETVSSSLTKAAQISFDILPGDLQLLQFLNEPELQVGSLTLDFGPAMGEQRALHAAQAPAGDLPLPPGCRLLDSFDLAIGGVLALAPQVRVQAETAGAMVLLRQLQTGQWAYAGRLTADGQGLWQSDPTQSDLLSGGRYALVALPWPICEVQGAVTFNGRPAPGTRVQGPFLPWLGLARPDGSYRFLVPQSEEEQLIQAFDPVLHKEAVLPLAATLNLNLRTAFDFALDDLFFAATLSQPIDQQTGVATNPNIVLDFNQPVSEDDALILNAVRLESGAASVPLQLLVEPGRFRLRLLPRTTLLPGTTYRLHLTTALSSLYGDPLQAEQRYQFTTRAAQQDHDLDLTRFYLEWDGSTMWLKAPAGAFPNLTQLRVFNDSNGYSLSTVLTAGDYARQVLARLGDRLHLEASTPAGTSASHLIGLTKTGPDRYLLGDTPFQLALTAQLNLRVEEIRQGGSTEVRILPLDLAEVTPQLDSNPALRNMPAHQALSAFRLQTLQPGDRLPSLRGQMHVLRDFQPDESRNLHLMSLLPGVQGPADPLQPQLLTSHILVRFHGSLAVRNGHLQPPQDSDPRAHDQAGPVLPFELDGSDGITGTQVDTLIFATELPQEEPRTPIAQGPASRPGKRTTVQTYYEPPAPISTVYKASRLQPPALGIPIPQYTRFPSEQSSWHDQLQQHEYPLPGSYLYQMEEAAGLRRYQFMGRANHHGQASAYWWGTPQRLILLDPLTGQMIMPNPHSIIPIVRDVYDDQLWTLNGNPQDFYAYSVVEHYALRGKAMFDPEHYRIEQGDCPPASLRLLWSAGKLDGSGQFQEDPARSEQLRLEHKLQLTGGLVLRARLTSSQAIAPSPKPQVILNTGEQVDPLIEGGVVTFTFPAQIFSGERLFRARFRVANPCGQEAFISDQFLILDDEQVSSKPGPPLVINTWPANNALDVRITQDLYVAFSEPVRGFNNQTFQADGVTFTFSDAAGNPVGPDDYQAEIYARPKNALQFSKDYTIRLSALLDQDGRRLTADPDADPDGNAPFRFSFRTADLTRFDENEQHYHGAYQVLRNLVLQLNYKSGSGGFSLTLYDARSPFTPMKTLWTRNHDSLPAELYRIALLTPDGLEGKPSGTGTARDDNTALSDLPNGTILAVTRLTHSYGNREAPTDPQYGGASGDIHASWGSKAVLSLYRYSGQSFTPFLSHPLAEAGGAPYALASLGKYLFAGFVSGEHASRGQTLVYDVAAIRKRLAETPYRRMTITERNQLGIVAKYPLPGDVTELSPFYRRLSNQYRPSFLISGVERPGILDFDLDHQPAVMGLPLPVPNPESPDDDGLPGNDPDLNDYDGRMLARTEYALPGKPVSWSLQAHWNGVVPNFAYGGKNLDVAVFSHALADTGYLYFFLLDPEQLDPTKHLAHRLRLTFPADQGGLAGLAVDAATGLIAVQNRHRHFSILDLRTLLTPSAPAESQAGFLHPAFLFSLREAGYTNMTFTDGTLYGIQSNNRFVRMPIAPRSFLSAGWQYLDLANWLNPELEGEGFGAINLARAMVFYATDLAAHPDLPTPQFVTELGSFSVETPQGLNGKLKAEFYRMNAAGNEIFLTKVSQDVRAAQTRNVISLVPLLPFLRAGDGKLLREQGLLRFRLRYRIESGGRVISEDQADFAYAYLQQPTGDLDPGRQAGPLDALSLMPRLAELDHTYRSLDPRADFSPGRAILPEFAFSHGWFGNAMPSTQALHLALPLWWKTSSGAPSPSEVLPTAIFSQPGHFTARFALQDKGGSAPALTAMDEPRNRLSERSGGLKLTHRSDMNYHIISQRRMAFYHKLYAAWNANRMDKEDQLWLPVVRAQSAAGLPPSFFTPLALEDQVRSPWGTKLTFQDKHNKGHAYPERITEDPLDQGGKRIHNLEWTRNEAAPAIVHIKAPNSVNLDYHYDTDGYLSGVDLPAGRRRDYTWETAFELDGFPFKRLISIAQGPETLTFHYSGEADLRVTAIESGFGRKELDVTRDPAGRVQQLTLPGIDPAPSQTLSFQAVAGRWLSSGYQLGDTSFTRLWNLFPQPTPFVRIVDDSFMDQSFDYDALGRLAAHSVYGETQSFSYGDGEKANFLTSWTDPLGRLFQLDISNIRHQVLSIPGGAFSEESRPFTFSKPGALIKTEDDLGFEIGTGDSRFYLPVSSQYKVHDDRRESFIPTAANGLPAYKLDFNQAGEVSKQTLLGVATEVTERDGLGRPKELIQGKEGLKISLDYHYENGLFKLTRTNRNSNESSTTYTDELGRPVQVLQVKTGGTRSLSYRYDDLGRLTKVLEGEQARADYSYTTQGFTNHTDMPVSVTVDGRTQTFTLVKGFQPKITGLTLSQEEQTRSLHLVTDSLGQVIESLEPGIGKVRHTYDAYGRLRNTVPIDAPHALPSERVDYVYLRGGTNTVTGRLQGVDLSAFTGLPAISKDVSFSAAHAVIRLDGLRREAALTVWEDSEGFNLKTGYFTLGMTDPLIESQAMRWTASPGKAGYLIDLERRHPEDSRAPSFHHRFNGEGFSLGAEVDGVGALADQSNTNAYGQPRALHGAFPSSFDYDPAGRLTKIVGPAGLSTTLDWDHRERLAKTGTSRHQSVDLSYLNQGADLSQIVVTPAADDRAAEPLTLLDRQSLNRSESHGLLGAQRTQETAGLGTQSKVHKQHGGQQASLTLDSDPATGLPQAVTNFSGEQTQFQWQGFGRAVTATLPSGIRQTVHFDGLGQPFLFLHNDRPQLAILRDAYQRPSHIATRDRIYSFAYEGSRLVEVLGGDHPLTFSDFDSRNQPARMQLGDLANWQFRYHPNGRPSCTVYQPAGGLPERYETNLHGDLTLIRRGFEAPVAYTYDSWGLPATIQLAGETALNLFDGNGRHTLHLPNQVTAELDTEGRLQRLTQPGRPALTYDYDADDRLHHRYINGVLKQDIVWTGGLLEKWTTHSSSQSEEVKLERDHEKRITALKRNVNGSGEEDYGRFDYEDLEPGNHGPARIEYYTDPNGIVSEYKYDLGGRVYQRDVLNGPSFNYKYDLAGNLVHVQVGDMQASFKDYDRGLPTHFSYDRPYEIIPQEKRGAGPNLDFTVSRTANGRLQGFANEDQSLQLKLYWSEDPDPANCDLASWTQPQITQLEKKGPTYWESWGMGYTDGDELDWLEITRQNAPPIREEYGPYSNKIPTALKRWLDGELILNLSKESDFSANHRRIGRVNQMPLDEVPVGKTTDPLQSWPTDYDEEGNLTRLQVGTAILTNHFDPNRRINEMFLEGEGAPQYLNYNYDVGGHRINDSSGPVLGSVVTLYEGSRVIAIGTKTGSSVQWTHAIGWGPFGPAFIKDLTNSGKDSYVLPDHLGTPFAWINKHTGATTYTPYNPWGELLATDPVPGRNPYQTGIIPTQGFQLPPDQLYGHIPPIGLTGHLYDHKTGLVYAHHRYLSPRLGHWLTADFRAPDLYDPTTFTEPYAYAQGNPLLFWDPEGLCSRAGSCGQSHYGHKGPSKESIIQIQSAIWGKPIDKLSAQYDLVYSETDQMRWGFYKGTAKGAVVAAVAIIVLPTGAIVHVALGVTAAAGIGSATMRTLEGQSPTEIFSGSVLTATGIGPGLLNPITNTDYATGRPLDLTPEERGNAVGVMVGSFIGTPIGVKLRSSVRFTPNDFDFTRELMSFYPSNKPSIRNYASVSESGLPILLQDSIANAAGSDLIIGVRTRPPLAHIWDGWVPAKPGAPKFGKPFWYHMLPKKLDIGLRVRGFKVTVSDLDAAFVLSKKTGLSLSNEGAIAVGNVVNKNYGSAIWMHGDNYNGVFMRIGDAIKIANDSGEIIYIFTNEGFIEAGIYKAMLEKYGLLDLLLPTGQ